MEYFSEFSEEKIWRRPFDRKDAKIWFFGRSSETNKDQDFVPKVKKVFSKTLKFESNQWNSWHTIVDVLKVIYTRKLRLTSPAVA